MQECSNLRTRVIHSLSTQFTDLSTAYTHVTNKLFYPISIFFTAGSLYIHTYTRMGSSLSIAS